MTRTTPDDKPAPAGRKKRVQDPDAHATPEAFDAGRAMTQSDFIVVYGPDKKILYVNPAMARAMGFSGIGYLCAFACLFSVPCSVIH